MRVYENKEQKVWFLGYQFSVKCEEGLQIEPMSYGLVSQEPRMGINGSNEEYAEIFGRFFVRDPELQSTGEYYITGRVNWKQIAELLWAIHNVRDTFLQNVNLFIARLDRPYIPYTLNLKVRGLAGW